MSKKKKTKTLSPSDNGEESSNEQDGARKRKHSSKHHSSSCDRTHRSTKSHDKYSTSKTKEDFQSGRQIKKPVYKLPKEVTHETRRSHHRSREKVEGKAPSLAIEPREKGSKRRVQDDREEVKRAAKHSDPACSHTTSDKHSDGSHRLTSKQRNVTQEPTTARTLQSQAPPKKELCALDSVRQIKKAVHKLSKDVTHKTRRSHHRSGEKVEGKAPSLAIEPREKGSKRRVQDDREEVKRAAKHSYPTCSHTTSDKHSDGSHRLTSKQRNVIQEPTTAKPLQSQVPPKKEESVHDGTSKQRNVTQEPQPSTAKPLHKVPPKKKQSVHDGTSKKRNVTQVPSTAKPLQSQVPPKKEESVHDGTSKQRSVTQEPQPPKKESVHDGTSKKRSVTQEPSTAKPLQSQVPPKKESVHDGTSKQRNVTQEPQPSTAKPLHKVLPKKESVHDGTSKKSNVTQVPSTAKPLQSQVPPKKESVHDGTSKQRNVTQEPQPSTARPLHKVPPKKESVHDGTSKQNVTQVPSTAKSLQSQVPPKKESLHDGTQVRHPSPYNLWKPLQSQVPPEKESVHDGTQVRHPSPYNLWKPLQAQVPPKKESVPDGTQVRQPSPYNLWKPLQSQVPPKTEESVPDGTQVRQPSPYNLWKPLQSQVPPKTEESVHGGTSKQRNVTQEPLTAKPLQSQAPPQKEESVHDGTQVRQPSPYNQWNIGPRAKPLQSQVPPKKESVHDGTSKQRNVTQVHSTAKPLQSQVPPKKEESVHDGTQIYDNDIEMEVEVVEELHEARSKDSLGLRLVKSYGELTSMDLTTDPSVEVVTEVVTEGPGLPQCRVIIAMDTNILLSHLDFVKKIMSHGLGAMGFPVILIPWVVLQELDSLKNGKGLRESVARLACPAVHFIYTCLKKQDSGVWGQSMQQASQSCQDLTTNNNDDRVLQCCLQYQSLYPERALFLCTNDKNLCSKSLISGVKALNKTDLEEEAKTYGHSPHPTLVPCDGAKTYGHSPHPTLVPCDGAKTYGHSPLPTLVADDWTKTYGHSPQPTLEVRDGGRPIMQNETAAAPTLGERTGGWQRLDKGKPLNKVQENERGEEAEERTTELSNCVSLMEDCLTEVLSAILEAEMKAAYEDLWDEIVYVKPPWSLKAVLECLNKHWIAVFGSIVPRHQQQTVKNLIVFFSPGKAVDCSTMLVALCEAKSLLEDFLCRSNYGNRVPTTLTSLDGIIRKLQPQTKQQPEAMEKVAVPASHPHENIATWVSHQHENSPTPMQNSHQDVWALFEGIWMNCMELCMKVFEALHFDPNTMQVNWPQGFPPPLQVAVDKLHHLLSVVTQLIHAFHRVLSSNSGCEETQALHTLIYSEGITMDAKFTVKDLLDCFAQQEYREKLRVGGIQLEELQARLERCVEAMGQDGSDTIMASTTHD